MPTALDRLRAMMPEASRRTLKQLLEQGRVEADGVAVTRADVMLSDGARVKISPRPTAATGPPPPLPVIFEDATLVVVNKPAGVLTVAERGTGADSAWARLRRWFRDRRIAEPPHLVHRLDRAASGLLVFTKTVAAHTALKNAFAEHAIDRHYAVILGDRPPTEIGEFCGELVELDEPMHRVRVVRPNDPDEMKARARRARTRWLIRGAAAGFTAVEVRLETGRKHQIRVHFAAAGLPVAGDELYGGAKAARLLLHAWRLGLVHPQTGERVAWTAAPPRAIEAAVPGAFRSAPRLGPVSD